MRKNPNYQPPTSYDAPLGAVNRNYQQQGFSSHSHSSGNGNGHASAGFEIQQQRLEYVPPSQGQNGGHAGNIPAGQQSYHRGGNSGNGLGFGGQSSGNQGFGGQSGGGQGFGNGFGGQSAGHQGNSGNGFGSGNQGNSGNGFGFGGQSSGNQGGSGNGFGSAGNQGSGNSFGGQSGSFASAGSQNAGGDNVQKHFYVFAAEDEPAPAQAQQSAAPVQNSKNYKIIFIKAPDYATQQQQILAQQAKVSNDN